MEENGLNKKLIAIRNLFNDSGATPGEKENAKKLFYSLLKKYGIEEKDLVTDEKHIFDFPYTDPYEYKLLINVIAKVTNTSEVRFWKFNPRNPKRRISGKRLWIDLTLLEKKEIDFLYSHYRKALKKELEKMLSAFLHTNKIFSDSSDSSEDENMPLSKNDRERILEIIQLMNGIKPVLLPKELPMLHG